MSQKLIRRPFGVSGITMGLKTLLPLLLLVAAVTADPYAEFRSNLENLNGENNLAESSYRLLDTVQPSWIDVDLDVYLDESRFDGQVQIVVDVLQDLDQIVLHQNVVSITAVSVLDSLSQPILLNSTNPFETDSYFEILKINLDQSISAGTYTIVISYTGRINENPLDRGFYKGYYYLNSEKRYYATTQFQPYHARKAFPCFDEPQFKSRFVISITRDDNLSPSFSNMDINSTVTISAGRVRETFLPTPIISAYLIAFHVSDFVETNTTSTEAKPFRIASRQGVTDQHEYAAQIGLAITNELDEYLDFEYYTMGQDQPMSNDHIALPDFPSGAMENWGMVNYREAYLLYDPQNTNMLNKIFIATIMAHELGHKWFGNLVTCFWWSNLWLNESFASFFEYFGAHMADPSLELDEQFVVDYVHSALNSDASAGATPMNWSAVETNPSISSHFSTTSYAKGASVLRMLEHFVGPTTFRNALRYYLKDNAYGLGYPTSMYAAFQQAVSEDPTFAQQYPGVNIAEVFDSWVQNPGSPVLDVFVHMSDGSIHVTQSRFQLTGAIPDTLWHIPVSFTHSGNVNFEDTKPALVISDRQTTFYKDPGHHWAVLNVAQSGLYRVNYDDHNWQMLAGQLRNNRNVIHKLSRAQMVNDILHFIRAGGYISLNRAFDVLSFLPLETDYYVWAGALGQLDWIRRRLEHLPVAYEEYSEWLLENMETVIQELGYEEGPNDSTSTILNRMQIMNYACNELGHQGCVNHAIQRFNQFRVNDVPVPVNERRYVYCVGLREGDASDYEFLYQKYNTSENTADMVVLLRTLACTKDEPSLRHYLDQTMYNDKIRIHDKTNAFSYALQGNHQNRKIVLDFVYNNYQLIEEYYGGADRLTTSISALATYLTDFNDISQFQTWLYTNQLNLPSTFATGVAVVSTSINNLNWGNGIATDLYVILNNRNSANSFTVSIVLLVSAAFVQLFK